MKIIEDRQKRDGESALSTYCIRSYRKMQNAIPHRTIPRHNGQYYKPPTASIRVPLQNFLWQDVQDLRRYPNGLKRNIESQSFIPFKRIAQFGRDDVKEVTEQNDKLKWPGIQEIMESYQRYVKGELCVI